MIQAICLTVSGIYNLDLSIYKISIHKDKLFKFSYTVKEEKKLIQENITTNKIIYFNVFRFNHDFGKFSLCLKALENNKF